MTPHVFFIGAGPGNPELLTIKAKSIIEQADVIIYADSLINPNICTFAKEGAEIYRSASMTLEQITDIIVKAVKRNKVVARLQSGDASIYGTIQEQMSALNEKGIEYEIIPGVSSLFAASAALKAELTVPEITQTVIITRMEGRTSVPRLESLQSLAKHKCTLAIFLSASLIEKVVDSLIKGGYQSDTPAALVYKASWEDEAIVQAPLKDLVSQVKKKSINNHALILVGSFLDARSKQRRSKLYYGDFKHEFQ